ncbi:BTAD domain-containing putative transcriptional regulator [Longispora sp. NPDC051575]|uniref:AfsR/SARP family transcriptional regulator n=1 Tax=Longispora sp. NPDC051575 TaxID=3154943 RepID=UPI00344901EA
MDYWALGPLLVTRDGVPVPVRANKLRVLLAAFLLRANQPLTVTELADRLWGPRPPANARRAVQVYVTRLRQGLGDDGSLIDTLPDGYVMRLDAPALDLLRFEELTAGARAAGSEAAELELLRRALGLWRGPACADVRSDALHRHDGDPLTERRLLAEERRIDLELRLGSPEELLPGLRRLTDQYPLREGFWAQRITALYHTGRQSEAIDAYWEIRRLLADELGVDPGPRLAALYRAMLSAEPVLEPAAPRAAPGPGWVVARHLPSAVPDFAGRVVPRRDLAEYLCGPGVPIAVLTGPPGVGKTALATIMAHQLRSRFPDGQWYARLAGDSPPARDPFDVLGDLLVASGMTAAALPPGLDQRSAALRSRLADRRVLLLLDGAADVAQVAPLLPGVEGSAVLVTSRTELAGLGVRFAARGFRVDPLDRAEAVRILAGVLGDDAVRAEPGAAEELAALCAYLPLALRIAATNAAHRPGLDLAGHVAGFRAANRLDALGVPGDPAIAVRAAFDVSYAALGPDARRAFRLLGLVPGADVTADAAAALLDRDRADVDRVLTVLCAASLVQRAADRFSLHDLLREYAAEHAAADGERGDAWRRLCGWYLRTADHATRWEYPTVVRLSPAATGPSPFVAADAAQAWLDAERANLVAVVVRAGERGPFDAAWQLEEVLRKYLSSESHLSDWQTTALAAREAAHRAGDKPVAGGALFSLAGVLQTWGRSAEAIEHSEAALDHLRDGGHPLAEASVLGNLGLTYADLGDARRAAEMLTRCVAVFRTVDMPWHVANGLLNLSRIDEGRGRYADAERRATECLELIGHSPGDILYAAAHINRASARLASGRVDEALADAEEALRTTRDRHLSAARQCLAVVHATRGDYAEALRLASEALRTSRADGRPRVEAEALNALATVYRLAGHPSRAIERYTDAARLSETAGFRAQHADALIGRALAGAATGDTATAIEDGRRAYTLATELDRAPVAAAARALLAELTGSVP